ncbi:MAG: acyltransferase [Bacteroidota bacterium]
MKRISSLDGFRALAIIMVVLTHARLSTGFPVQFRDAMVHGAVGVNVFFVISGFLITTLLLNEQIDKGKINVKHFFIKRAFRILPVALLYLVFVFLWRTRENIGLKDMDIIRGLTFTINFSPGRGSWFIGHYWTLSIEEQFYIFWPAIMIIFRKNLKMMLILLIAYSCIIKALVHHYPILDEITLSSFFSYSDSIFIGALGGIFYIENPGLCQHKILKNYWMQLGAISFFVLFVLLKDAGAASYICVPFANVIIAGATIFLILAYINPSATIIFKLLNSRILTHLGILSYSIYIWQQFFIFGARATWWRTFPNNILVIYLVALGSYYLWEKPFLKLRQLFIGKT